MKRVFLLVAAAVLSLVVTSCSKYRYEEVVDDPLHSRIYTLDNGLKVYMTVNGEAPRIQTYIAVRVGSKNDPLETTGLAHYFEHLMFAVRSMPASTPCRRRLRSWRFPTSTTS